MFDSVPGWRPQVHSRGTMEFKFAALDSKRFNLRPTGSSVVLSAAGEKWSEPAEAAAADSTKGRDKQRLIQSSGPRIASGGKIGPAFKAEKSPKWLDDRSALFDRLLEKNAAQLAGTYSVADHQEHEWDATCCLHYCLLVCATFVTAAPKEPIAITLPDGAVKEGVSFQTTPMDIAQSISSSLAKKVIVAKVRSVLFGRLGLWLYCEGDHGASSRRPRLRVELPPNLHDLFVHL